MIEITVEELVQYYDRFIEIVEQISMNAENQINKLKGTIIADEIATDFSEIGMRYAKKLLETSWITETQFLLAKSIDEKLRLMSKNHMLWSEEALFNSIEWEECRKLGNKLLSVLKK